MSKATEPQSDSLSWKIVWGLVFLGAALLAFYGRFAGLGLWPFAHDEFYFANSVGKIVETGSPELGCGGLYMRGIVYQYILSIVYQLVGHSPELVFRMVNSFFGALTIIPVWLLAKRLGGIKVALVSTMLVALSLVEIETSRFLRMYAPFQALFCFYAYFLYMGIVEEKNKYLVAAWLVSLFSVFIHISSMVVSLLNFTAFLKKPEPKNFFFPLLISILAFSYINFDFRNLRSGENLPEDFALNVPSGAAGLDNVMLPKLFLPFGLSDKVFLFYLGLVLVLCLVWVFRLLIDKNSKPWLKISLSLCVLFALLNQFTAMLFGLLIVVAGKLVEPKDLRRGISLCTGALVLTISMFWFVFALSTDSWHELYDAVENPHRKILSTFLKYPDFYEPFLARWYGVQPITVVMMSLLSLVVVIWPYLKRDSSLKKNWFLFYILLVNIVIMGVLKGPAPATRYTFYLYPIMLIIVSLGLKAIANRSSAIFLSGFLTFLFLSEDYSISHITNISTKQGNFREGMVHEREVHLWQRLDFRSPAEYVNANWRTGDKVLIFTSPISYYLENLNYMYLNIHNAGFKAKSACGGEREAWTMADLLYKPDEFIEMIEERSSRLWVIARNPDVPWIDGLEEMLASQYRDNRVFEGGIGRIDVFKFE